MNEPLLNLLEISCTVSLIGLVLNLLSPALNKRFTLTWKGWIWSLLGLRLLIPVSVARSQAPVAVMLPELNTTSSLPGKLWSVPAEAGRTAAAGQTTAGSLLTPADLITLLVLTIACILLLSGACRYLLFRRHTLRWSLPAPADLMQQYKHCGDITDCQKIPALRISKQIDGPMLLGICHPVILLPDRMRSGSEAEMILCHELIHYRNRDIHRKLILYLAKTLHWFNPLVLLMARQAEQDLEAACDEQVLHALGYHNRYAYGSLILNGTARQKQSHPALTTSFGSDKKRLKERIVNIMRKPKQRGDFVMLVITLVIVILAARFISFRSPGTGQAPQADTSQTEATPVSEPEKTRPQQPDPEDTLSAQSDPDTTRLSDIDEEMEALSNREYEQLLTMRYDGWQNMSVNTFNQLVRQDFPDNNGYLNELYAQYDAAASNGHLPSYLTEEETSFLSGTLNYTINEFSAESRGSARDIIPYVSLRLWYYSGENTFDSEAEFSFALNYEILHGDTMTVAERDKALNTILTQADLFLSGIDDWEHAEEQIISRLDRLCEECSNSDIQFMTGGYDFTYYGRL